MWAAGRDVIDRKTIDGARQQYAAGDDTAVLASINGVDRRPPTRIGAVTNMAVTVQGTGNLEIAKLHSTVCLLESALSDPDVYGRLLEAATTMNVKMFGRQIMDGWHEQLSNAKTAATEFTIDLRRHPRGLNVNRRYKHQLRPFFLAALAASRSVASRGVVCRDRQDVSVRVSLPPVGRGQVSSSERA